MINRRALMAASSVGGGVLVDDVFSTDIYTGNSSTQTITNDIDLDGEGGLVWIKSRSASYSNYLINSESGITLKTSSDATAAQIERSDINSFNSDGFSLNHYWGGQNNSGQTFVGWTFRKSPKFFDVVTYTGTGTARTVAHDLGSTPGMFAVKSLGTATEGGADGFWFVYHREVSTPEGGAVFFNNTDGRNGTSVWNSTLPTDSVITVNSSANISGREYVAYLFAHDDSAGGAIQCGSFTTVSNTATVTLGWSPQFVITKRVDTSSNWEITDIVRGSVAGMNGANKVLKANLNSSEQSTTGGAHPSTDGTGMQISGLATGDYIYMAIRAEE